MQNESTMTDKEVMQLALSSLQGAECEMFYDGWKHKPQAMKDAYINVQYAIRKLSQNLRSN